MKRFYKFILLGCLLISAISCSLFPKSRNASLHNSPAYYNYLQPDFKAYLSVTEKWLKHNRQFLTEHNEKEIAMNMPFELGSRTDLDKAILLVHGLGDSPFSFSDVAKSLNNQGFYVQVLLLPGHGSKPKDLMLPSYNDWQTIVDHYASLLKADFNEVWLGGYSTGGNLVTIHTIENNNIDGLVLFAPGFQSNIPVIERFAPLASIFVDVVERNETNLVKYISGVTNGGLAYTESAFKLRDLFEEHKVTVPALLVISESDSAVDSKSVKSLYLENFVNSKNKVVWYGNEKTKNDLEHQSVEYYSMKLDEQKISTGSHMSPLFAPDNVYYGKKGERRMCEIEFKKSAPLFCQKRQSDVWYAAWGHKEEGKKYTRLTWNPYYEELEQALFYIAN